MAAMSQNSNDVSRIQVEKLNAPLGAKITGVDFSQPINDEAREFLNKVWSDHLILIFLISDTVPSLELLSTTITSNESSG